MFSIFNEKNNKILCDKEIIKLIECIDNNIEKCLLKNNKNNECYKYLNLLKKCDNMYYAKK
jgi:hypothetical protein